jgi:hypothetical protein
VHHYAQFSFCIIAIKNREQLKLICPNGSAMKSALLLLYLQLPGDILWEV